MICIIITGNFFPVQHAIPSNAVVNARRCRTVSLPQICFSFMLKNVIDRKPYPDDENLVEVKFARTPIMSTYLVAFVVGEYDFVETRSLDGVLVRVYTPVGKAEQGKFALEVNALKVILVVVV